MIIIIVIIMVTVVMTVLVIIILVIIILVIRGAIQTHCATLNVDSTLEIWPPIPPLLTSTRGTKKIL